MQYKHITEVPAPETALTCDSNTTMLNFNDFQFQMEIRDEDFNKTAEISKRNLNHHSRNVELNSISISNTNFNSSNFKKLSHRGSRNSGSYLSSIRNKR